MRKYKRIDRAIRNFTNHAHFKHRIILRAESRLDWNEAYEWCISQFGEPGARWDFYFERIQATHLDTIVWNDTFGFQESQDATVFTLRWI